MIFFNDVTTIALSYQAIKEYSGCKFAVIEDKLLWADDILSINRIYVAQVEL